jgi:hypothetical protein
MLNLINCKIVCQCCSYNLVIAVQVWSSDSGVAAHPPSELVMKGTQKWTTGDTVKSVLLDADGQVSADCVRQKKYLSRPSERCVNVCCK